MLGESQRAELVVRRQRHQRSQSSESCVRPRHVLLVENFLGLIRERLGLAYDLIQLIFEAHKDVQELVDVDEVLVLWPFLACCGIIWLLSESEILGLDDPG
jgi:hypothetical protein